MNTHPDETPRENELQPSAPTTITRRSFIKRSTATILITALALHSFRNEARADENTGSGAKVHPIQIDALSEDTSDVYPVEDAVENGIVVKRNIIVTLLPTPRDLTLDKPAPSKTATIKVGFNLRKSTDGGTTWATDNMTQVEVSMTVANQAFPNEGDITFSSTGVGQSWNGFATTGVQIIERPDAKNGPRACSFAIEIVYLFCSVSDPNDVVLINGALNYTVYPGDENPPAMFVEHQELVRGYVNITAGAEFSEL